MSIAGPILVLLAVLGLLTETASMALAVVGLLVMFGGIATTRFELVATANQPVEQTDVPPSG